MFITPAGVIVETDISLQVTFYISSVMEHDLTILFKLPILETPFFGRSLSAYMQFMFA